MAPAHPHATLVAVYPALFFLKFVRAYVSTYVILVKEAKAQENEAIMK